LLLLMMFVELMVGGAGEVVGVENGEEKTDDGEL
jgi:hypothetical protein